MVFWRQLRVEREDGIDFNLLALGLAALVPLDCHRPRLQIDPRDDRWVNPAWKMKIQFDISVGVNLFSLLSLDI